MVEVPSAEAGCARSRRTACGRRRQNSTSLPDPRPFRCCTPRAPQISECDGILAGLEGMLGRFQSDLGAVSAEIRALQDQSQSMSQRLKNRRLLQVGGWVGGWVCRVLLGGLLSS